MPLIKHTNAEEILQQATVLDLGDLRRAAEQMLHDAHEEAQGIVSEAKAEAVKLRADAVATGHAEGLEQGRLEGRDIVRGEILEEMRERIGELAGAWTEAVEGWERRRRELLLAGTEDVLAFAITLGEKVVHRVIDSDPSVVREQMAEALALVSRPGALDVCINPEDRAEVDHMLPGVMREMADCEHIGVREDSSITRGGCVVRTRGGVIDARIETQLQRITEALLPGDPAVEDAQRADEPAPPADEPAETTDEPAA